MARARDDNTVEFPAARPRGSRRPSPEDTTAMLPVDRGGRDTGRGVPADVAYPAADPEAEGAGGDGDGGLFGGLLPMLDDDPPRRFETVRRGYDRRQVDDYVARLEEENRALAAGRVEAPRAPADPGVAAELAAARTEVASLRARLATAVERVDPDNVDARVQEVVALAQQVARQTRRDADAEAARTRADATAAAETLRTQSREEADRLLADARARFAEAEQVSRRRIAEADEFSQRRVAEAEEVSQRRIAEAGALSQRRVAEADRYVAEVTGRANQEVQEAREAIERAQATSAAQIEAAEQASRTARDEADQAALAAREEADRAALQARTTAAEDFEITLRRRRHEEDEADRTRHATAVAEARATVADARATAERIVREAREEVDRLEGVRRDAHRDIHQMAVRLEAIVRDRDVSSTGG